MAFIKNKSIKKGGWRTVEWFFNAKGITFFKQPKNASIKVRYGVGWFGKDRQKQKLDGATYKKLEVATWSLVGARMQIRVPETIIVTYYYDGSGVAQDFPKIKF